MKNLSFITVFVLMVLLGLAGTAGAVGIVTRCHDLEDAEDQHWCYMELAVEQKTIKYCNHFISWLNTKSCIEEVAKVKTITPQDCSELVDYAEICAQTMVSKSVMTGPSQDQIKKLAGCTELLNKYTPLGEGEAGGNADEEISRRLSSLKNSLIKAVAAEARVSGSMDKPKAKYTQIYADIMKTCEENAKQANLPQILIAIQNEGREFKF